MEDNLREKFGKYTGSDGKDYICANAEWGKLKSFIHSRTRLAYEQGRKENEEIFERQKKEQYELGVKHGTELGEEHGRREGRKEERERIERVVEDFDVVNDTMGNPVKNPLMHVRDVKNLIISRLKEQPHEHK